MFFWNYARNTWQWDALCVVILIFIFLTPKEWFGSGEPKGLLVHQNRAEEKLLVSREVVENAQDNVQLEHKLRELERRPDLQLLGVRKLTDQSGKIMGYEVDIR